MVEVLLASDQWRQGARPTSPPAAAGANDAEELDRLRYALEFACAVLLGDKKPRHLSLDIQGNEDRARLGLRLHPRGDIGRIAEHLAAGFHDDRPGLNADARGKRRGAFAGVSGVDLAKRALDRERRAHRALSVVLLRVRIAEQRHQPVAELLQHMTAKIGHRRRGLVEIGVDEVAPVLGVELRGQACRADEIAEHHGDRAALGRDVRILESSAVGGGSVERNGRCAAMRRLQQAAFADRRQRRRRCP